MTAQPLTMVNKLESNISFNTSMGIGSIQTRLNETYCLALTQYPLAYIDLVSEVSLWNL